MAVAEGLKRRGFDAFSARDVGNLGLTDMEQLQYALAQRAVLVTHDDDFLKLAHLWGKEGKHHAGIAYTPMAKLTTGDIIHRIQSLVDLYAQESFQDHIEFL